MKKSNLIYLAVVTLVLFVWLRPTQADNILVNGDLEDVSPNFWSPAGAEQTGVTCEWAWEGAGGSEHSFKVTKTQATAAEAGWVSDNNANLYWNAAKANLLYNLSFKAKTEGVNTNPASDDARIGALFSFYASGTLLAEKLVPIDQSAAAMDWTEFTDGLLVPPGDDPDEMIIKLIAGKEATGTVWFDDIGCGSDPWSMWPFNGDVETPQGWMNWADAGKVGYANLDDAEAASGSWSVLLKEEDANDDEMVFYSEPVPVEPDSWYKISVKVKRQTGLFDEEWLPSNITDAFADNRMNVCFFYHREPLMTAWELTGGDQFFYFDERDENSDWREYSVISKSPEDAVGISVRARYNPFTQGLCWYDDFAVQPAEALVSAVEKMVREGQTQLPAGFELAQNFPNPFNPSTHIGYTLSRDGFVQLDIYNMLGQRVRQLVSEKRQAGVHVVNWDGRDDTGQQVVTGVYIYQLRVNGSVSSKTMVLVK